MKLLWICGFTGNLVLPSNLISIGKKAFQGCNNITTLTIPANVITIGENAFKGIDRDIITNNSSAEGYPWGAE